MIYLCAGDTLVMCETAEEAAARLSQLYLGGCRSIEYLRSPSKADHDEIIRLAAEHIAAGAVV